MEKKKIFVSPVERVRESTQELNQLSSLMGGAMLTGLGTIINRFTISFSATLRLSFGFLTVGLCGMLYGPVLTGLMGIAVDLLRYLAVGGGAYFPGFTLNEFIVGFLYGYLLYHKPVTLPRVFLAKLSVTLLINLCLTPLWLSILYGDAFIVLLAARVVKNLLMLPVETLMLFVVCKKVGELRLHRVM